MELELLKESFSICRMASLDGVRLGEGFAFLSVTDDEVSLVCPTDAAPKDAERVDGRRALRVRGELDFALVGIIADISSVLAERRIPVFVVSTYNTDYVFVEENRLDEAVSALEGKGYAIAI